MKASLCCTLFFMILHLSPSVVGAANRGLELKSIVLENGNEVPLYGKSYALLIGSSDYQNGWTPLPGVVADIQAVKEVLETHKFHITEVMNPTREQLLAAFDEFRRRFGNKAEDRLVIYYAGHGHSLTDPLIGEAGYIVPVEAPLPGDDMDGFLYSAIDMEEIRSLAKRFRSKHAYFVFDSCFAGTIFRSRAASVPAYISDMTGNPVRQFQTAGDANEVVPDVSIFRRYFVRALQGEADVDGDGYILASEIENYLKRYVIGDTNGLQHPRGGKMMDPRFNEGDVVFGVPEGRRRASPSTAPTAVTTSVIASATESVTASSPIIPVLQIHAEPETAALYYEQGLNSLLGKNTPYDMALASRAMTRAAEAGHVRAAAILADMYYSGADGSGIDFDQAWQMLQRPAQEGDLFALSLKAKMQHRGIPAAGGVLAVDQGKLDLETLAPAIIQGAESGDPLLASVAGYIYDIPPGDIKKAIYWFEKAASLGFLNAKVNLGNVYYQGKYVRQDKEKAMSLFTQAAEVGNPRAMTALAFEYASQKTAEETRLAIEWYERAIELGDASAFAGLGAMYLTHPDLFDKPKAIRLFKKGAQLGDSYGMRQLGLAHLMGHGVTKDGAVAISWFRKAIKLNDSYAIVILGRMYASGEGVTRDFNEAFRLMQEAAARDQTDAMNYLADAYSRGVGVPVDRKQALVWVTKAAEMGDPWAKANLPYFQQFQ